MQQSTSVFFPRFGFGSLKVISASSGLLGRKAPATRLVIEKRSIVTLCNELPWHDQDLQHDEDVMDVLEVVWSVINLMCTQLSIMTAKPAAVSACTSGGHQFVNTESKPKSICTFVPLCVVPCVLPHKRHNAVCTAASIAVHLTICMHCYWWLQQLWQKSFAIYNTH